MCLFLIKTDVILFVGILSPRRIIIKDAIMTMPVNSERVAEASSVSADTNIINIINIIIKNVSKLFAMLNLNCIFELIILQEPMTTDNNISMLIIDKNFKMFFRPSISKEHAIYAKIIIKIGIAIITLIVEILIPPLPNNCLNWY